MALLTNWSALNRVVTSGLNIKYKSDPKMWTGKYPNAAPQFTHCEIYRYCTKQYEYIGMTKATAKQCLDAMRSKYTRSYAKWEVTDFGKVGSAPYKYIVQTYVFECTSSIEMQREAGDAWKVTISVNEEDKTIARGIPASLAELQNLFAFANIRDYDEGGDASTIVITSAIFNGMLNDITISYSHNIDGFSTNNLSAQIKNGATWTSATTIRKNASQIVIRASKEETVRVVYTLGETSVVSNEVSTATASVSIKYAYYSADEYKASITYTADAVGFDASKLKAQIYDGDDNDWHDCIEVERGSGAIVVFAKGNETYRLNYNSGELISNEIATTDPLISDDEVALTVVFKLTSAATFTAGTTNVRNGLYTIQWDYGDGGGTQPMYGSPPPRTYQKGYYILRARGYQSIASLCAAEGSLTWLGGISDSVIYIKTNYIDVIGTRAFAGVGAEYIDMHAVDSIGTTNEGVVVCSGEKIRKMSIGHPLNIYTGAFPSTQPIIVNTQLTMHQIQSFEIYPFDLVAGSKIICSDGTITIGAQS